MSLNPSNLALKDIPEFNKGAVTIENSPLNSIEMRFAMKIHPYVPCGKKMG